MSETRKLSSYELVLDPKPAAHFGVGAVSKVGELAAAQGAKSALIITDPFLGASPICAEVRGSLRPLASRYLCLMVLLPTQQLPVLTQVQMQELPPSAIF